MDHWRRSGQIPAFGNWEQANELPITQYFESARQAGLIRYSSSGECDRYMPADQCAADFTKPCRNLAPPKRTRFREKRGPHVKEQKKQGKVCDGTDSPRKQHHHHHHHRQQHHPNPIPSYNNTSMKNKVAVSVPTPTKFPVKVKPPKAVDEDLYKIPPELLRSSKRKKRPGLFSCLVPACAS